MPTDSVLVQIVTAANMAGIKEAQAGFLGMSSSLTALVAGIGLAVVAGKSMIDNAEKMEAAHRQLQQATSTTGISFGNLQAKFDAWADANRNYINDQYDAETALAAFVRAGNSEADSLRLLNDALDLSVIKHENVSDAEQTLEKALVGNSKGLKDLGITTDEYNSIMKDKLLTTEEKHQKLLALIEAKTKDGREATTDLAGSTNALNKDWQDISAIAGPPLLGLLTGIASGADWVLKKLKDLGNNKSWADAVSAAFGIWQNAVLGIVGLIKTIIDDIKWLIDNAGKVSNLFGGSGRAATVSAAAGRYGIKAAGGYEGMVSQPTLFLAGEAGPESVSIRPGGDSGGGHTINISIGTYVGDASQLSRMLAHELRLTGAF